MTTHPGKAGNLARLALAVLLAKSLWFSASAVVPQLTAEWGLTGAGQSWLTMSVQVGFVAGAFASALLTLADRVRPDRLIAAGALAGAVANVLIVPAAGSFGAVLALRFVTGAALALVYPPGMKLAATWCKEDRGLGIGILVAALTVGSALPHLVNAFGAGGTGMPPWPQVLVGSSVLAVAGSLVAFFFVRPGPHLALQAPFDWRFAGRVLADRPTRLANFGYLGHMWELYAMWAWVPIMILVSYDEAGWSVSAGRVAGFVVIAVGAVGALAAGLWADRAGRTTVTVWSLAISGACALASGFTFSHPGVLTIICVIWGLAVVADSAQFSAAVSELTDPRTVGTALTLQTSLGFLLTLASIRVIPALLDGLGWEHAFMVLALGPAFGIWSMLQLRRLPEASRMAGGMK